MVNYERSLEESVERINRLYEDKLGTCEVILQKSGDTTIDGERVPTYRLSVRPENPGEDQEDFISDLTETGTEHELQNIIRGLEIAQLGDIGAYSNGNEQTQKLNEGNSFHKLEFWTVIDPDIPDYFPDHVDSEDILGVKHDSGKVIGVEYIGEESTIPVPDHVEKPAWAIRGPNSFLSYEKTLADAQEELFRYANKTNSPSGMV